MVDRVYCGTPPIRGQSCIRCMQKSPLSSEYCTVEVLEGLKICPLYGIVGCSHFRGYNVRLLMGMYTLPEQNVKQGIHISVVQNSGVLL